MIGCKSQRRPTISQAQQPPLMRGRHSHFGYQQSQRSLLENTSTFCVTLSPEKGNAKLIIAEKMRQEMPGWNTYPTPP